MIALFLAVALAAPREADLLEAEWRSLQLLRADPQRYRIVREPFTISDGPLELTISEGVLVPIFSGHLANDRKALRTLELETSERGTKEFVGFVFTAATATATVSWQERADNLIFANHMVRNLGHDRADFEAVARGESWSNAVGEGMVLSIDPAIQAAFVGPDDEDGDPFEVVVYGDKPRPGSRARAVQLLDQRVQTMKRASLPPGRQIASDRVAAARGLGPQSGQHLIIDLHTSTNFGSVMAESSGQPRSLDWMTLVRDDTGVLDSRLQSRLTTFDVSPGGRVLVQPITGVPFPPLDPDDPLSPPAAPVRMEAYDAYSNIVIIPRGADVEAQITSRLKLRAVGGPIQWFDLNIPLAGKQADFKVISVKRYPDDADLLAQSPLLRFDPVLANKGPDEDEDEETDESDEAKEKKPRKPPPKRLQDDPYLDKPESRITVALPEPLQAGDDVILDVVWTDAWPMTHIAYATPSAMIEIAVNLGEGTGRQGFLPRLTGAPVGNPSRFRARVAVPTRSKLSAAISGARLSAKQEGDWNVLEAGNTDYPVPFADVAVARFAVHDEAADGFPVIRTRLLDWKQGPNFAQEARRLIRFYQGYLPSYPWPEHEVFQGPGMIDGWIWVASHEMTSVMKTRATGVQAAAALARGNTASRVFAHEMAHQWWGHLVRPAHRVDFWISETFAEEFACMYMEAVFGACDEMMTRKRKGWEKREELHIPRASLIDAYSSPHQPGIVYQYGPYVFHRMLQSRMGHRPYHAALDLLLVDHPHEPLTTERLLDYFNRASDEDLTDYFNFWVYAGFVPEDVVLTHHWADGSLELIVTADVPFGTFDVPVVVDGDSVWVDVIDGRGSLSVSAAAAPEEVELDPHFLTLIKRRRTTSR